MIHFFGNSSQTVFAVQSQSELTNDDIQKLNWLFGNGHKIEQLILNDSFVGPRAAMITPWSTNAVEITQNMDIEGISRIERFISMGSDQEFDPMLFEVYNDLNQTIFDIHILPEPINTITDIESYNQKEGLALSKEEV